MNMKKIYKTLMVCNFILFTIYVNGFRPTKNKIIFYWSLDNYTEDIHNSTQVLTIQYAFETWSSYMKNVSFEYTTNKEQTDINFSFDSNISDTINTSGNLLGYAISNYKVVFNDRHSWCYSSEKCCDLKEVAIHEIGHILGLPHNETNNCIMNPYNSGDGRYIISDSTLNNLKRMQPHLFDQNN